MGGAGKPPGGATGPALQNWAYIFGAVCPARGVGAGLLLPYANTYAMNLHLTEISALVTPGAHCVLTVDGAGWHQLGGQLVLPSNISLLHLPPYSPEPSPRHNAHLAMLLEGQDFLIRICC